MSSNFLHAHRRLIVLTGDRSTTAQVASALIQRLPPDQVLWIGEADDAPPGMAQVKSSATTRRLGGACAALCLDAHDGVDPDVLGRCHGFVRGGGALILRCPPSLTAPLPLDARLALHPHTPEAVHRRWRSRLRRLLATQPDSDLTPITPIKQPVEGTAEQDRVVARLGALLDQPSPQAVVLIADRGRGKSAALGLALARLQPESILLTGPAPEAIAEVLAFAGSGHRFTPLSEALLGSTRPRVLVVDEAAQVPVPLLKRLVARHPQAHLALATTVHGYEGTGRGFVLRFLRWLEDQPAPVTRLELSTPIRWAPGDPLERFVFQALLLAAEAPPSPPSEVSASTFQTLDRDQLATDDAALAATFGLLVHAHYRTTPGDLWRLLDAPNLAIHTLSTGGEVAAVCQTAEEGDLPEALIEQVLRGRGVLRGHALPEILIRQAGQRAAGRLSMIRSVRIATHPDLRRQGLASALTEALHERLKPDLFGTLFGATPALIAFRRSLGYRLVWLGVSAGSRTGEPSAVMVRPVSDEAQRLVAEMEADLARDLPAQLDLMASGGHLVLAPELVAACLEGAARPAPMTAEAMQRAALMVGFGGRPLESAAAPLQEALATHPSALARLDHIARQLLTARLIEGRDWIQIAAAAEVSGVRAAMRATRRAVAAFAQQVWPEEARRWAPPARPPRGGRARRRAAARSGGA